MSDNTIESTIAEAVKAKVQIMVVEALGDPAALVRNLVAEALTLKVKDREYPYKEEPVIHRLVRKAITAEAQTAMQEWIDEQRPAIKAELKRRLVADKASVADALINSLTGVASRSYGLHVVFKMKDE